MCALPSESALMTWPSADRDWLIFFASSSVCPFAPVLPTFSLPAPRHDVTHQARARALSSNQVARLHWSVVPARSTRLRRPLFFEPSVFSWSTVIMKTEWLLELTAFMLVDATARVESPASSTPSTCRGGGGGGGARQRHMTYHLAIITTMAMERSCGRGGRAGSSPFTH
jgi:hypothetical protein